MSRTDRITELEREIAVEMEQASLHFARAAALREEVRLLREGAQVATDVAAMSRVDAIVAVLRHAGAPMSPTEIGRALVAAGRAEDSRQTLTASLDYLRKQERIVRVGRGQYAVAA
ncbi:hypothetical protein ER308_16655 [Egibacter rhizosphaerae]|uniref:Uncharacterized protein n=1 Tax=Egibacter rhizosphaerae TaxID=1670831 RepID=A0A411YIR3_9ACTN|nr:hypothetical protein [Egibacter rhizosphaerae]QBI21041.1 hypothetical protein ER308_16655 [Egibacter rhizosphaerae]